MRLSAATFLVAVAALVGGCAGSSPTATSGARATSTAAEPSSGATSAVAGSSTATAKPQFFASIENCEHLARIGARFVDAFRASTRDGKLNVQRTSDAFQALASSAPSAIRRDLQLLADKYSNLTAALTTAANTQGATPTASQVEGIRAAGQEFNVAKLRAEHLVARLRQNCDGI